MPVAILVALAIAALVLISGLNVLREYERAVVFRLGRLTPYRGPGVTFIFPHHRADGANRSAHHYPGDSGPGRHHP